MQTIVFKRRACLLAYRFLNLIGRIELIMVFVAVVSIACDSVPSGENGTLATAFSGATLWTAASDRTVDEEITKPVAELSKPTDYIVHPVYVKKVGDVTVADFGKVIPARPMITFANGTAGKAVTIYGGYDLTSDGKRDIPEYSVNMPQWIWNYYMNTGDKATLEYAYPYMKATDLNYIANNISSTTGLVEMLEGGSGGYLYGIVDWPASGRFGYDWNGTQNGARATVNMLSKNAFDVVALAAGELGYNDDKADMESCSQALTHRFQLSAAGSA